MFQSPAVFSRDKYPLQLPDDLARVLKPVFDQLPPSQAMPSLVVEDAHDHGPGHDAVVEVVERVIAEPQIANHPALIAGLWLYADELDRSHAISQKIDTPTHARVTR